MGDKRKGWIAGLRNAGPLKRFEFYLAVSGIVIAIYFGFSSLRDSIKLLNNQIIMLAELEHAQKDRDDKFYVTLKNISKAIFLNTGIEEIKVRVYFNSTNEIDNLKGSQILCELIKVNVLNPKFFIDISDKSSEGIIIGGKKLTEMNRILYNSWTKLGDGYDFHKLITETSPKKGYVESYMYIHPDEKMRSLKVSDFNNTLVRVLVNDKAKGVIEKIELFFNNKHVLSINKDYWEIEKARLSEYPSEELKSEAEKLGADQKWYLLGEIREDTIEIGPFKLQFL